MGGGVASGINAALVAQAAQGPGTSEGSSAYTPPTQTAPAAPTPNTSPYTAQPYVAQTYNPFAGATPVSALGPPSANPTANEQAQRAILNDLGKIQNPATAGQYVTPQQTTYSPFASKTQTFSPYLSVPGTQNMRNPFVSRVSTPQATSNAERAATLTAQMQQYNQASVARAAAAKQAQIEQANRIQQAFLAKQEAARAAAEAARLQAERELAAQQQQQQQQSYYDNGFQGGGANGGIADLYEGFKR